MLTDIALWKDTVAPMQYVMRGESMRLTFDIDFFNRRMIENPPPGTDAVGKIPINFGFAMDREAVKNAV